MSYRNRIPRVDRTEYVTMLLIVIVVALWIWYASSHAARCEKAGGVYLIREMKCVIGIKEVTP